MNFSQIFPPDKDNEFSNRENKRNLPITTPIYIHYPYWNERENFLSTSMISQLKKKSLEISKLSLYFVYRNASLKILGCSLLSIM